KKQKNTIFINDGFRDWKNAIGEKRGIISNHSCSPAHLHASELAENVLSVAQGQQKSINSVLSDAYAEKVGMNRKALLSILDVINLSKRNIALRGNWTGEKAILSQLEKWGLEIDYLRGQGYDGASAMSGHVSGVQQRMKELQPRALFTHCRSHALNLVVVHGCSDIPLIRNTMATIENIAHLLSENTCYKKNQKEAWKHTQVSKGKQEVYSHVGHTLGLQRKTVGAFLDHFKSAHSALTDLESRTSSNSNKANNLRHSMESFDTIVTAVTTNKILGYIQPLTKELQSPNIDLMTAYKEPERWLRNEEGFCDIYAQSIELASTIDVVPSKKRVTNRQQNRANTPSQSIEEHYRLNLFYPFIDHVTSQLNTRFVENSEPAMLATYLIPSALSRLTKDKQEMMVSWYREDLPQPDSIDQEIHRWKVKNQPPTLLVSTAKDTLNMINVQYYPNIHCILSIYLTLPVTTCSCERSFSALRRLKTWLRSSIGNDRLSGLAMMHVHRNRALDPEKVLKRWDACGHRRIVSAFDRK
ncbi:hypothetical protein F7725_000233, partial [Dissostichus mawsoni]